MISVEYFRDITDYIVNIWNFCSLFVFYYED